mmetsp:Transcript_38261/g.58334  ORF Transcript_38261/g.58334 Transcript_38261/m.58334 type:complete len:167 (+) Transcript_38261:514-1014(+)|eukprot:CAMPEP_0170507824 /NCGR_PEP_ID=MMETSP0208-20121228/60258_1 /TAXON_ID=197538 /ORGANISM="Strombidium inclinatum, Strain S3" /LENGTH=166 /DNA_ID=CAMNT_0010790313 /DNA_START=478 /DNA_END=978 /DNA_ORIENTATION=-
MKKQAADQNQVSQAKPKMSLQISQLSDHLPIQTIHASEERKMEEEPFGTIEKDLPPSPTKDESPSKGSVNTPKKKVDEALVRLRTPEMVIKSSESRGIYVLSERSKEDSGSSSSVSYMEKGGIKSQYAPSSIAGPSSKSKTKSDATKRNTSKRLKEHSGTIERPVE